MGLLTPKGNKGDKKKNNNVAKNNAQGSKFINKGVKGSGGFVKKGMTGGSQRGS
jgi:hypothetical protein